LDLTTSWLILSSELHPLVQRWMHDAGWKGMRPVQLAAVQPLQNGESAVISAPTAGGKTEAAFLPLLGMLADHRGPCLILAVCPLKALINDQHRRLSEMTKHMEDVAVFRWHGDVQASERAAAKRHRRRVILITPESIEAQIQNDAAFVRRLSREVICVVIDELHAFLDGERGVHLRSLLARIDQQRKAPVQRVGLSATLADPAIAQRYLRASDPDAVRVIVETGPVPFRTQMRAVVEAGEGDEQAPSGMDQIADHIFERMRGTSNLVFANSKRNVEELTDLLVERSKALGVPNEFVAHHGNLSRDLRAEVESRLQAADRPTTAICTSTMELGIDIGDVTSVGQVGAPYTVASLRQRLGRSGRRGTPSILRSYVIDRPASDDAPLLDRLHVELAQAVAMTELMLARWLESPPAHHPHLSTLVHQIISLLGEHGAMPAGQLWLDLVVHGAFDVDQQLFRHVLTDLGRSEILYQLDDGLITLAPVGDRLVSSHEFYAAFATPEEFRIVHGGRTLGSLPIELPLPSGAALIFAGQRWTVLEMDTASKTISVSRGGAGKAPRFGGSGQLVDRVVHERIFDLYATAQLPSYLDEAAQQLLTAAQSTFHAAGLVRSRLVELDDGGVYLLPWGGDRVHLTLMLWLRMRGVQASQESIAIRCSKIRADHLHIALQSMYEQGVPDAAELSETVPEPGEGKYHYLLSPGARREEFARTVLDVEGAHAALADLV
jgi:ATP-dependent Lhr-like helicase